MKRTNITNTPFFALIFLLWAMTQPATAQYSESPNAISINGVGLDYYSPFKKDFLGDTDKITFGAKIAYHRNFKGDFFNLEIPLSMGAAFVPNIESDLPEFTEQQQVKLGIGALAQIQYFKETNFIVPYFSTGFITSYIDNGGFHVEIPVGIGLDFKIKKGVYLQLRPEYRFGTIDENRDNYNLNLGFKWFLKSPEPLPIPPDPDRDKDGILNEVDKCPDVPGVPALFGCPDGDGDGITDNDDLCPDIAGLAAFYGCPDSDGDGITDIEDNCPDEAGPPENSGCPWGDQDGDGINDKKDECPNIPGTAAFNGCPDTDGDGIEDRKDDCPKTPGIAAFNGCPDTDGDGVKDGLDKCPKVPGPIANQGCPEITVEEKETLTFAAQNVQFETNRAQLRVPSYTILDQVADILKKYPAYNVSIEGHTDSTGPEAYNQKLSADRARACFEYLAKRGIVRSRMKVTGYGESQPIADNATSKGKELNRRVEFNVYLR